MPTLGGFNWLDFVLFILFGFGLTVGYMQGLLRQVLGLAALYVAAILATQYFVTFAGFLRSVFFQPDTRLINAIAFFIILLGVSAVINFLAADAYRMTKLKMFPLIDQLGGSIMGLIVIVIVISLVMPIVIFVSMDPVPYFDVTRYMMLEGIQTSRLVLFFQAVKPFLLNSINPWIPGGLPSIFSF